MFKSQDCFYSNTDNNDGLAYLCIECKRKEERKPESIWRKRYSDMKRRVDGKNDQHTGAVGKNICSKTDFLKWCKRNKDDFMSIYRTWKESDYARKYSPSIDRVDGSKGYTLDNIRWTTVGENSKGHENASKMLEYKEEKKSLKEWSKQSPVSARTFRKRLRRGWSMERSLNAEYRQRSWEPSSGEE